MGEGRNLELEIERKAKKKAMKESLMIFGAGIVAMILLWLLSGMSLIPSVACIIGTIVASILCYIALKITYQDQEEEKALNERIERKVPIADYVEVMPTEENNSKDFMEKLKETGIARFYAIRNERFKVIEIYAKFDKDEDMYDFAEVEKEEFEDEYVIVEEKTE